MRRCENCGIRLDDQDAPLCRSCAYSRKKRDEKEAARLAAQPAADTPQPSTPPDPEELRERLRRVEETLRE